MKQIINGKKYDTDTAEHMADWWNGKCGSDFSWCQRTLYRKKTGEYFEYGEGGAMTVFSRSCGDNTQTSGSSITPLTIDEAMKWCEKYAQDKYETVFGEVGE